MSEQQEWRLTRGRVRYETVGMAADRHNADGRDPATARRSMVRRFERAGLKPDDHLDDRTPVYLVSKVDKMIRDMPGKGVRRKPAAA